MSNNEKFVSFPAAKPNPDLPQVTDVRAEDLREKTGQVQLIDVRQPGEYVDELGHIPGAKLITLDTLPERIDEIQRDSTVVFVCRSGGRSARAAAFAIAQGFERAYNLQGGMLRWNSLGFETEGKA